MKTNRIKNALAVLTFASWTFLASKNASAAETPAYAAHTGMQFGIGPDILLPLNGGAFGGGLDADLRIGIGVGPLILSPGLRLAGYAQSGRFIGMGIGTGRIILPIGPFAPYAIGGLGLGFLARPGDSGMGVIAGGGLMLHFGRPLALGLEMTFQTVTGTGLQALVLTPSIIFRL